MTTWVANFAFQADLEAEQDDPSVKNMSLEELAWPTVVLTGDNCFEVIDRAKRAAEKEYEEVADTKDFQTVWNAPEQITDKWWKVFGSFVGDEFGRDECYIVVRGIDE